VQERPVGIVSWPRLVLPLEESSLVTVRFAHSETLIWVKGTGEQQYPARKEEQRVIRSFGFPPGNDAEYVGRVLADDEDALKEICEVLLPLFLNQARAVCFKQGLPADLAEDFAQEVMLHLLESNEARGKFWRLKKWHDSRTAPLDHYAASVSSNKLTDLARGVRIRQRLTVGEETLDHLATHDRPHRTMVIRECLSRLPNKQREALELRFAKGLSSKEAAEQLDCTPGAVDALVMRARKALGKDLFGEVG
jgi:RNA polymerase sigma factor (sigma-70 family)